MKKIIVHILFVILLCSFVFVLSGCTLQIQTTDNSVSASVDEDTTKTVDNVIDWIKERFNRLFKTDEDTTVEQPETQGEII